MIVDCHSHSLRHDAIVAISPSDTIRPGYVYSIGLHPWMLTEAFSIDTLLTIARSPQIVAIGETGLDTLRGPAIPTQIKAFEAHIDLSESLAKPLIIHCVKAHQLLLEIHRSTSPRQPWIIHGFRRKPAIAELILNRGILLSIGPRFNPATAKIIPSDTLLIETDDDPQATPRSVAEAIAPLRQTNPTRILTQSAESIRRILNR